MDSRVYKFEGSWNLENSLDNVAKALCACFCLFDAIVELHPMDEKCSMSFSLESVSELYMSRDTWIHDLY